MKVKKKAFPKSVFVYRGEEGGPNEYMAVTTQLEESTELGETKKLVGIYDLRETITVSNRTMVE